MFCDTFTTNVYAKHEPLKVVHLENKSSDKSSSYNYSIEKQGQKPIIFNRSQITNMLI